VLEVSPARIVAEPRVDIDELVAPVDRVELDCCSIRRHRDGKHRAAVTIGWIARQRGTRWNGCDDRQVCFVHGLFVAGRIRCLV
jgi:hypothetical protein